MSPVQLLRIDRQAHLREALQQVVQKRRKVQELEAKIAGRAVYEGPLPDDGPPGDAFRADVLEMVRLARE